jgi:hypothetical protein
MKRLISDLATIALWCSLIGSGHFAYADYRCQSFATDFATPGQAVGVWFLDTLGVQGASWRFKQLKGAEKEALGSDPRAALALTRANQRAENYRVPTCNDGLQDGALDAVRHFVLSATLASMLGRTRAIELLTAHEAYMTKDPNDLPSSLMDLHNNSVGANYGSRYFKQAGLTEKIISEKGPMSDDAITLALAEAFRRRELRLNKKADSTQSTVTTCDALFQSEREILRAKK